MSVNVDLSPCLIFVVLKGLPLSSWVAAKQLGQQNKICWMLNLAGGIQPIWKIWVKLEIFPNFRGEHKKYLSCHHPVNVLSLQTFTEHFEQQHRIWCPRSLDKELPQRTPTKGKTHKSIQTQCPYGASVLRDSSRLEKCKASETTQKNWNKTHWNWRNSSKVGNIQGNL